MVIMSSTDALRSVGASRPRQSDLEKTQPFPDMVISRPILGTEKGGSAGSLGSSFDSKLTPFYGDYKLATIRSVEKI